MVGVKNIVNIPADKLPNAVKTLIENRVPESLYLDYKQTLDISKDSGKKELAKDVSSFANEQGGILIYGVPEDKSGDLPKPKPLSECGMENASALAERIESILLNAVDPPLHALNIQVIDLPEIAPKQLLVIRHPESYLKPHMVIGYNDKRYYRRCNFQTVPMGEREVKAAYQRREATRTHARDFFKTASFGAANGIHLRAVACPVQPGQFKERMLAPSANPKELRSSFGFPTRGDWVPFLDGWRYLPPKPGSISGRKYEIRIFHNGAVCLNLDLASPDVTEGHLLLDDVAKCLHILLMRYTDKIFQALGVAGPVVIQISLIGIQELLCIEDEDELERYRGARDKLKSGKKSAKYNETHYYTANELEEAHRYKGGEKAVFEEETSADEIREQQVELVNRLITRIGTAFGRWITDLYED